MDDIDEKDLLILELKKKISCLKKLVHLIQERERERRKNENFNDLTDVTLFDLSLSEDEYDDEIDIYRVCCGKYMKESTMKIHKDKSGKITYMCNSCRYCILECYKCLTLLDCYNFSCEDKNRYVCKNGCK